MNTTFIEQISTMLISLDPMQLVAASMLAFVFLIALIGMKKETGFLAQISTIAPNTLTSIGIFFTFLGILLSLKGFDVERINQSIPELLNGLKLAFLSSVIGLGLSVVYRLIEASSRKKEMAGEVTAGDLLSELKQLNKNTISVRESLIGDSDSSLSTQFGKLRNDFRDFAERMKEDGTQALVKALEEVIKDFNQKITEQFGENFKQLNEAVGALLKWQVEYKSQVEYLTQAFKETKEGIETVEQSVSKIPEHMQKVETAFDKTEDRMVELYDGLGSLAEIREAAVNAVPELTESISEMTSGLKASVDEQMAVLNDQMRSMHDLQSSTSEKMQDLTSDLSDVVKTALDQTEKNFHQQMEKFEGVLDSLNIGADNVLESTQKVARQVDEIIENFTTEQNRVAKEIKSQIDLSMAENVDAMNKSMQDLDQGMQQQLQRALDKMGNNLASITDTFVTTYEENARKVTELTSSILAH